MRKVYAYFVNYDANFGFTEFVIRFRVDDTITDDELNDPFTIDYIVRAAIHSSTAFSAIRLSKDEFKIRMQNGISKFSDAGVIVQKLNGKYVSDYKD